MTGVALLAAGLIINGCLSGRDAQPQPYRETRFLMDTAVEITAYGPEVQPAVQAALAEFQRIQTISDRYSPDSQVTRINQMAGIDKVVTDPSLLAMVNRAGEISQQTDGAFDISVGALTELWGVGHKGDYVPAESEISRVLPLVDYRRVITDMADHTVFLPAEGMKLDLGGIAKGYAINRAANILRERGIQSALINAGGDIQVIGPKPGGMPWRIGVQDPRSAERLIAKITLTDWDMMETSGDYQRYFIKAGIRYTHILDPKTGKQPREVAGVTLVYNHRQSGLIPSSAFMVLGVEKGIEVLRRFPGVEAIFVTADGRVIVTPGLEGRVELIHGG